MNFWKDSQLREKQPRIISFKFNKNVGYSLQNMFKQSRTLLLFEILFEFLTSLLHFLETKFWLAGKTKFSPIEITSHQSV